MNEKPSKVKFLSDNRQVVYSIFLMVIIPVIIIVNTLLCAYFFKNTINQSLQEKAVAIGESINSAIADKLDSPEQIQSFIDGWSKYNSDTESLDIFYPEGEGFKLIASLKKSEVGRIDNVTLYTLTWAEKWPVAQKIYESSSQRNGYYWLVLVPLKNTQGEQKALLSMYLSTTVVDKLMSNTLSNSYLILIVSVLIIVLLLFANSRIFEYAILYNKIKEIDQMKDEFISMASHELRTPITVIRGYVEMILENKSLDSETKEYLSIVNISTERLNALIEDLLDVSRIEQGRLKMSAETMDVWPIIESTLKELKVQADAKGLVLSSVLDPGASAVINADKDRLKQVLINIIGNSIKYTPTGGVEVKAINRDKKLIIFIKDTGIGMSAKERERLFEKFYRVKNKKTSEIGGTGLGLWITKQIVELMNGTISVDSMEGVGTQATLEFPLVMDNKKLPKSN